MVTLALWRGAKDTACWKRVLPVYMRPWFQFLAMQNNNKENVSIVIV